MKVDFIQTPELRFSVSSNNNKDSLISNQYSVKEKSNTQHRAKDNKGQKKMNQDHRQYICFMAFANLKCWIGNLHQNYPR